MILEEYYKKNRKRWVRDVIKIVGNKEDAEDVIQEAFIRAFRYFSSFKGGNINGWFYRIMINCCVDFFAKRKRYDEALEQFQLLNYDSPDLFKRVENKQFIQKIIRNLSLSSHQDVVILYYLQQYSAKEVASMTGETEANVRKICLRFKERIKEAHA